MAKLEDLVLAQWKLAIRQAGGDAEGVVSILASALAFAAVEGSQPIDEIVSRVRDDHQTGLKARADLLRSPTN